MLRYWATPKRNIWIRIEFWLILNQATEVSSWRRTHRPGTHQSDLLRSLNLIAAAVRCTVSPGDTTAGVSEIRGNRSKTRPGISPKHSNPKDQLLADEGTAMISGSGDIQRDCGYCREVWPVKLRLSKSYATRAVPLDGRADGRIIDNPTAGASGVCIC